MWFMPLDHLRTFHANQEVPGEFPNGLSHLGASPGMAHGSQIVWNMSLRLAQTLKSIKNIKSAIETF